LDEVEGGSEEGGCTVNEGPVRIQYKCLVPIYLFPEIKLRGLIISKTEGQYNVLPPNTTFMYMLSIYSQDRSAYFDAAK
jgi:hypothetical protein